MADFWSDGGELPPTKTDSAPVTDITRQWGASDANALKTALQSVRGAFFGQGTAGQVLTSNGAGALPSFQTAAGGPVTWFSLSGLFVESLGSGDSNAVVEPLNNAPGVELGQRYQTGSRPFTLSVINMYWGNAGDILSLKVYLIAKGTGTTTSLGTIASTFGPFSLTTVSGVNALSLGASAVTVPENTEFVISYVIPAAGAWAGRWCHYTFSNATSPRFAPLLAALDSATFSAQIGPDLWIKGNAGVAGNPALHAGSGNVTGWVPLEPA